MTKVYLADISPLEEEAFFRAAWARVPRHRQEKVNSLRFPADRRRSLAAWLLLEKALARWGIAGELRLSRNPYGKPFLADYPDVHFSLSHSGNKVLCALSDGEVGCDLQQGGKENLRLADRFFSPEEARFLNNLEGEARRQAFFRLWTLKESYIKAVGMGLSLPMKDFSLDLSGDTPVLTRNPFPERCFFFREFPQEGDCFCACCAPSPEMEGLFVLEL